MVKAVWEGVVLAESNQCEIVERNYYFPPDSINKEFFLKAQHTMFVSGRDVPVTMISRSIMS